LRLRGDQLPAGDFDIVVSIGVIHHIPEPESVLAAALRALKPKGVLLIWVYGHEGARVYKSVFLPVRMVTKRLPIWLNECLASMLYPVALVYGWLTTACRWLPLHGYYRDVWFRFTPDVRRLVILDQINPRWAKYYRQTEITQLVRGAGFEQVRAHHRHGYSWTVIGVKPG
jgi:SAM-dependent methyltransferase